jgi:hypothetical protein
LLETRQISAAARRYFGLSGFSRAKQWIAVVLSACAATAVSDGWLRAERELTALTLRPIVVAPRRVNQDSSRISARHIWNPIAKNVGASLHARSATHATPSASRQPYRRAVFDGFDAEHADTSGTSRHRYRPGLDIVFLSQD